MKIKVNIYIYIINLLDKKKKNNIFINSQITNIYLTQINQLILNNQF